MIGLAALAPLLFSSVPAAPAMPSPAPSPTRGAPSAPRGDWDEITVELTLEQILDIEREDAAVRGGK